MERVTAALVGGPMYDPLYELIPAFTRQTGIGVDVVVQLPHPELNAWVRRTFASGAAGGVDLLSTHTKYAPSQAQWLSDLDDVVAAADLDDLLPRPAALARIDGHLLQVPRNVDVRLLHYRRDLLPNGAPSTWSELAAAATAATTDGCAGFLFPGRDSGLFGTFYELLVGAGGELFHDDLSPAFESPAGVWAVAFLVDLYAVRRVAPRALVDWHYDEISAEFRAGRAAMVCDWPGSYHLYRNPSTCRVAGAMELALLPAGPAGSRSGYGGCHSFAIPRTAKNREGAASLMRFFTSHAAQLLEARAGSIPCRASALARVRDESAGHRAESSRWELLAVSQQGMIVPPRFAAYPACEDAIWRAVQRAMREELPPARAVALAAADVRRLVNEVARPS
ncbi:MAG TPA: extracellular solute-binding protein [Vicinamibacterales bacterium]|nr:extracellular solute-binding protein [Vicinamibacterales bacterium]